MDKYTSNLDSLIEEGENSANLSSTEVGPTVDEPTHKEEFAETENQEKATDYEGQVTLYEELQYFPEMEENDNENENLLEFSNRNKKNVVTNGILDATTLANDLCIVRNKISRIYAKSEVIENELKVKDMQYKAIEVKSECYSLFLNSATQNLEYNPNEGLQQFTDEEIKNFCQHKVMLP